MKQASKKKYYRVTKTGLEQWPSPEHKEKFLPVGIWVEIVRDTNHPGWNTLYRVDGSKASYEHDVHLVGYLKRDKTAHNKQQAELEL